MDHQHHRHLQQPIDNIEEAIPKNPSPVPTDNSHSFFSGVTNVSIIGGSFTQLAPLPPPSQYETRFQNPAQDIYAGFNQTGSNFAEFQPAPNSHRYKDPSQEFVTKLKAWAAHIEVVARASQNSGGLFKSWAERLREFTESAQHWAWIRHASKLLSVLCVIYVFIFAVIFRGPKDPPSSDLLSSELRPSSTTSFSSSSCAIINGDTTYVFSQASDGSLIVHYGSSYASNQYLSTTVVPGDSVVKRTPIACILVDYQPPIRVYFLTPAKTRQSNILNELVIGFDMIDPLVMPVLGGVAVPLNSRYMYAIADAGQPRVGYQCKDNTVCEFAFIDFHWKQLTLNW